MTMSITRRDIDKAHSMLNRQRMQAERDQARKETYMGQLAQTAEISGAALATGFVYGRFAVPSLGPIPLDLLVGLALQGLGFSGMAGKYSNDAHNLGDGVLAAYFAKLGAGLGASMLPSLNPVQTGAGFYGAPADPGMMGQGYANYANAWQQGGGLSDETLAAMAAMA